MKFDQIKMQNINIFTCVLRLLDTTVHFSYLNTVILTNTFSVSRN